MDRLLPLDLQDVLRDTWRRKVEGSRTAWIVWASNQSNANSPDDKGPRDCKEGDQVRKGCSVSCPKTRLTETEVSTDPVDRQRVQRRQGRISSWMPCFSDDQIMSHYSYLSPSDYRAKVLEFGSHTTRVALLMLSFSERRDKILYELTEWRTR